MLIYIQDPVINNLPDDVYISEDTGHSILIFTINATDSVTALVTCTMTGTNINEFTLANIPLTTGKCPFSGFN